MTRIIMLLGMLLCWTCALAMDQTIESTAAFTAIGGLPKLWMDIGELVAKLSIIPAGLFVLIRWSHEARQGTLQKASELAQKSIDKFEQSKLLQDAFLMLDWSGREYEIDGKKDTITFDEVKKALRTTNLAFDDKEVYIRDCFDTLFSYLSYLEVAVNSKLFPFNFLKHSFEYNARLLGRRQAVMEKFMRAYSYDEAIKFLGRFQGWNEPARTS